MFRIALINVSLWPRDLYSSQKSSTCHGSGWPPSIDINKTQNCNIEVSTVAPMHLDQWHYWLSKLPMFKPWFTASNRLYCNSPLFRPSTQMSVQALRSDQWIHWEWRVASVVRWTWPFLDVAGHQCWTQLSFHHSQWRSDPEQRLMDSSCSICEGHPQAVIVSIHQIKASFSCTDSHCWSVWKAFVDCLSFQQACRVD